MAKQPPKQNQKPKFVVNNPGESPVVPDAPGIRSERVSKKTKPAKKAAAKKVVSKQPSAAKPKKAAAKTRVAKPKAAKIPDPVTAPENPAAIVSGAPEEQLAANHGRQSATHTTSQNAPTVKTEPPVTRKPVVDTVPVQTDSIRPAATPLPENPEIVKFDGHSNPQAQPNIDNNAHIQSQAGTPPQNTVGLAQPAIQNPQYSVPNVQYVQPQQNQQPQQPIISQPTATVQPGSNGSAQFGAVALNQTPLVAEEYGMPAVPGQKTLADFAPDHEFVVMDEDLGGKPILQFNNGSIKLGKNYTVKRTGPLTFYQTGYFGDGVTPNNKDIPFPDERSADLFFEDMANIEIARGAKQMLAGTVIGKVLTPGDIDALAKILPPGPPPEAVSNVSVALASMMQSQNNRMANGQQVPEKVYTEKDHKEGMRSYAKTMVDQIRESVPARFHGGMKVDEVRDIFARASKLYKYELRNDGGGYYGIMTHGADVIRMPENPAEFLPVVS